MRPGLAFALIVALLGAQSPQALAQSAGNRDESAAMQNLLAGITQGTPVVLYTPLADGLVEVTRFRPPLPVPRPSARAAIAIAREHLTLVGIRAPTGNDIAHALVGGTVQTREGPLRLPAVLPTTGAPALVINELLQPNGLPFVAAPGTAAPGGSLR